MPAPSNRARSSIPRPWGISTARRAALTPGREIVVGTNEEYQADSDGGANADLISGGLYALAAQAGILSPGNTRLYAIEPDGDRDSNPDPSNALRPGWPAKIGIVSTELLPVVGEGVTGSPAIGPVNCPSGGQGAKVTVMPAAGFSYLLNPNGQSCYGRDANGKDRVLNSVIPGGNPQKYDAHHHLRGWSPRLREPWRLGPGYQRAGAGDRADPLA